MNYSGLPLMLGRPLSLTAFGRKWPAQHLMQALKIHASHAHDLSFSLRDDKSGLLKNASKISK
jgi:hypothetical protein